MKPVSVFPSLYNVGKDKYTAAIEWQTRLHRLARFNSHLIEHPSEIDTSVLEGIYHEWYRHLIHEHAALCTMERCTLGKSGIEFVHIKQANVMTEMFRLQTLLHINQWIKEQDTLCDMDTVPEDPSQFDILWSLSMTKSRIWLEDDWKQDGLWTMPIIQYTQRHVVDALHYICERLLDMPTDEDSVVDFKQFTRLLMGRIGQFCCTYSTQDVLNVETMRTVMEDDRVRINREFIIFTSTYCFQLLYKIDVYNMFWPKRMVLGEELDMPNMEEQTENVRQWIYDVVCKDMRNESFESCYYNVIKLAYNVPGDYDWYRYKYPAMPTNQGTMLQELRPLLFRWYGSEDRGDAHTLWISADRYRMGFVGRQFIVTVLDDYLKNFYKLSWEKYVIVQDHLLNRENQFSKMFSEPTPLLIQVMSRFWVYDNASWPQDQCYVWPTDSIYEAIAVWFHILVTRYHGRCMELDLNELIKSVFEHIEKKNNPQQRDIL